MQRCHGSHQSSSCQSSYQLGAGPWGPEIRVFRSFSRILLFRFCKVTVHDPWGLGDNVRGVEVKVASHEFPVESLLRGSPSQGKDL